MSSEHSQSSEHSNQSPRNSVNSENTETEIKYAGPVEAGALRRALQEAVDSKDNGLHKNKYTIGLEKIASLGEDGDRFYIKVTRKSDNTEIENYINQPIEEEEGVGTYLEHILKVIEEPEVTAHGNKLKSEIQTRLDAENKGKFKGAYTVGVNEKNKIVVTKTYGDKGVVVRYEPVTLQDTADDYVDNIIDEIKALPAEKLEANINKISTDKIHDKGRETHPVHIRVIQFEVVIGALKSLLPGADIKAHTMTQNFSAEREYADLKKEDARTLAAALRPDSKWAEQIRKVAGTDMATANL